MEFRCQLKEAIDWILQERIPKDAINDESGPISFTFDEVVSTPLEADLALHIFVTVDCKEDVRDAFMQSLKESVPFGCLGALNWAEDLRKVILEEEGEFRASFSEIDLEPVTLEQYRERMIDDTLIIPYPTNKHHYSANMVALLGEISRPPWPKVTVLEGDMFQIAGEHARQGKRVCIHNFANNHSPGCYETNPKTRKIFFRTNTQEEQLLRATLPDDKTIWPSETLYPICKDDSDAAALFTDAVRFDKDRKTGEPLPTNEHFIASVITCPAIHTPRVDKTGEYVNDEERGTMLARMILMLTVAAEKCDIFVTGLWGAGVFNHPIERIAELWGRAIDYSKKRPPHIIFSIYIDTLTNLDKKYKNGPGITKLFEIHCNPIKRE